MRELGPIPPLIRLGLVVGPVPAGAVLLFHDHHLPTITPLTARSAIAVPSVIAPTNKFAWSDAQILQPAVDADFRMAAKLTVPAPPQTELVLQGVDPRGVIRPHYHG